MSMIKQLSIQMSDEKQISVDPISLHQQRESAANYYMFPPPAPPTKSKFLSYSLPNSASCSPVHFTKKKQHKITVTKDQGLPPLTSIGRQNSVALTNLERLREIHIRRSKSCGEGRTSQPSVDFDLLSSPNVQVVNHEVNHGRMNVITNSSSTTHVMQDSRSQEQKILVLHAGNAGGDSNKEETSESQEEKFKCGLMCPFLPFGKEKTVKAVRSSSSSSKEMIVQEPVRRMSSANTNTVSRRVSLEKFECGSWRSSAVINCEDQDGSDESFFFDLPVELIRCSNVDTESPITTAFLFDKNTEDNNQVQHHRKGVLKNTSSTTGNRSSTSQEPKSPRHVRFSTSSPIDCPQPSRTPSFVSPHVHNVRDDFSAFLEAQSA